MILYLCREESVARFEGNPYVRIESRVMDSSLLRFAQQGVTNLAHCDRLLIDLGSPEKKSYFRRVHYHFFNITKT